VATITKLVTKRNVEDPALLASEPPAGTVTTVYNDLRARIVTGLLKGDELLVEQDIAEALGVSRTPVREALRKLAAQGLVVLEHRRRGRVATIGPKDTADIYRLRTALETMAAERAASEITPAVLAQLERISDELEELAGRWDPALITDFYRINMSFHMAIMYAARSRWLETALRPVIDLPLTGVARTRHLTQYELDRACRQHRDLIDALRSHDGAWARALMEAHILSAYHTGGDAPL
jgi:DNA-binding GntR family transcriptional regulator